MRRTRIKGHTRTLKDGRKIKVKSHLRATNSDWARYFRTHYRKGM
jgi:hypothetical protein